jgi:phospholipid transport system transporter-binding protein
MKTEAGIRTADDGWVYLSGELTFESTPFIYEELEQRFQSTGDVISVDLGGIERTDSAGLALLLEWQAAANRRQRTLHIRNAPDNLIQLAKLCEADKLLKLLPRAE